MATLIQIRRDSQANWILNDPVLASGEIGFSSDLDKLKIGDGSSLWSQLAYINSPPSAAASDTDAVTEGVSNLYFTNQRALDATSAAYDAAGAAATAESNSNSYSDGLATNYDPAGAAATAESNSNAYSDGLVGDASVDGTSGNTVTDRIGSAVSSLNTNDIPEGSNLYFTNNRALLASAEAMQMVVEALTSDDITEGSNLYFTDARAQAAVATDISDAVSTASADATSKANSAESDANTYADGLIGDATVDGTGGNTVTDRIASAVSGIVDSAPATLDTLNELSAALGDDPNFATTVSASIGEKVVRSGDTMTGDLSLAQDPTQSLHAATKQYVDTAESDAVSSAGTYTDGRETAITTAYQAYADTAEADAISTASADATSKADAAQAAAESTASADATSKADTAESNANTFTTDAINALDTDDIEEGTANLYFTEGRAQDATPGRVTSSITAPTSPSNGDGWLDLDDGSLYIYVNDGVASQWIQA